MPNFVKIGQAAAEILQFFDFSIMAAAAILDFQKWKILRFVGCRRPICVIMPNFVKIGQTVVEISRFNAFFQNGGCPPSWISKAHIWTIHDDYLVGVYLCAKFG